MVRKIILLTFTLLSMLTVFGCAAHFGVEHTGTIPGMATLVDGSQVPVSIKHTGKIPGYEVYTVRSQDPTGINTASTFLISQKDGSMIYGNTAAQAGIRKVMVEQIIPGISNATIGTFTGVFFPKPVGTNIGNVKTGNMTQGQGQITGQSQGQIVQ